MISRREFLITAAKIGSTIGSSLAFAQAAVFDRTGDLIRSAPKARYWISTASPGIDCLQCHKPESKLQAGAHAGQKCDGEVPPLRPVLRHQAGRAGEMPRPHERQRRIAQPGLWPASHDPHRSDREETLLSFPSRLRCVFLCDLGLSACAASSARTGKSLNPDRRISILRS